MALKILMKKRELELKKTELENLRSKDEEFSAKRAELEKCIGEVQTDEEKTEVTRSIEEFETDHQKHEERKNTLSEEIRGIEEELRSLEAQAEKPIEKSKKEERKDYQPMIKRYAERFNMTVEEFRSLSEQNDVKEFISRTRNIIEEQRAVKGAELSIPTGVMYVLRENMTEYSKLLKYVNQKSQKGKGRVLISGAVPEAVWTEACGKLNELNLEFNDVELDGYKVAGFIPLCNAIIEDSDIDMLAEIMTTLSKSLGAAIDKAIVYGTGKTGKMPLGFVTRLAQETQPEDYPATARKWADLHTSNVITITEKTDLKLIQAIISATGAAKGKYSSGTKFWVMNEKTKVDFLANALAVNSAGAIVAGANNTMPLVGGDIVTLEFMADGDIAGGYGDLYTFLDRRAGTIAMDTSIGFVEDKTYFKGTQRCDGAPAIAEGFVIMNIAGKAPTTTATFATDTANAG